MRRRGGGGNGWPRRPTSRIIEHLFPKIVSQVGGRYRFVDQPPILYHVAESDFDERMREGFEAYRQTLPDERRVLLDRYRLEDYAMKAVGIGSVGTRCAILLLFSEENHPLILQVKEARRSVLEPYAGRCPYGNQGQRVVVGQRLTQSSSDIFLGWVRGRLGFDFYVRQLRDMKMSAPMEGVSGPQIKMYAELCGWTLARAHAKSGDSATISGYLGKGDQFDEAMGAFSVAYADQTERDHAALVKAARKGASRCWSKMTWEIARRRRPDRAIIRVGGWLESRPRDPSHPDEDSAATGA